eukprot:3962139-Ditylum_brightwellii.AAC.1
MCLYSKKVLAKDTAWQFVERVKSKIPEAEMMAKKSEDVQKSRYSHQDWITASETVSSQLKQKLKEHRDLLF